MKRFIATKFFHAMQEVSQKGTLVDMHVLRNVYDEVVVMILSEYDNFKNLVAYRNALVYTVSEIKGMAKQVPPKKQFFIINLITLIDKQIEWVEKQIAVEQGAQFCPYYSKEAEKVTLQWTDGLIDLVELTYALHASGSIDNGEITLTQLFQKMGAFFGIEVKEFSRTFSDVKSRTKGDRTSFLNKLKRALIGKLEDADEKPSRK
ncbi:MAG: RteC domain-containing protein [Tannerella sp.]|jgi:hypothetical protein|nr:RteC domain-containing protein [Tannerella sp.]